MTIKRMPTDYERESFAYKEGVKTGVISGFVSGIVLGLLIAGAFILGVVTS